MPKKVGRPTKYTPGYCKTAIEVLSEGHSVTGLAGYLGVPRKTIYEWANAHSEFRDALKIGQARSALFWEETLKNVALKNEGNASAAIFAVKNRVSDDWMDKFANEHTGKDGGPIQVEPTINPDQLDDETLQRLLEAKQLKQIEK